MKKELLKAFFYIKKDLLRGFYSNTNGKKNHFFRWEKEFGADPSFFNQNPLNDLVRHGRNRNFRNQFSKI